MTNTMVWLAAMIILIIIEIVTVGLTTIWFAIGALVAIIVSMLGGGLILQMTVFLLISLGMLIFTRPLAVRYINKDELRRDHRQGRADHAGCRQHRRKRLCRGKRSGMDGAGRG